MEIYLKCNPFYSEPPFGEAAAAADPNSKLCRRLNIYLITGLVNYPDFEKILNLNQINKSRPA